MYINEDFIAWVKKEASIRGMSQAKLAKAAHCSPSTISAFYHGLRGAGTDLCDGIAIAFGYSQSHVYEKAGLLRSKQGHSRLVNEIIEKIELLDLEEQRTILSLATGMVVTRSGNRGQ